MAVVRAERGPGRPMEELERTPWWAALAAAAVAALVERTPWPVDDNLVIPVTVAAVLHLAAL